MADDSTVLDQPAETAVDTGATVDTAQSTDAPAPKPYSERLSALKGKAYDHWKMTGDVGAAEKLMVPSSDAPESDETQSGADNTAQTQAASDPAVKDQPKGRDRDWNKVRSQLEAKDRELIAVKAKLEIYERDRAGSGPSAPATNAEAPKPEDSAIELDLPDLSEYDDPKKFKSDTAKAIDKYIKGVLDSRFTGEKQQQQYEHSTQKWNAQVDEAKKVHKDFTEVAFSKDVPLTYATWGVIENLPDGALRTYALGKNLVEAQRIAQLTHIPGEEKLPEGTTHAEFLKWVKSDPDRAMLYGRKLAAAETEISKLQVTATKQAAPQRKPLKEVIAGSQTPSAEVNVDTSTPPVADPIQEALKRKDFETYKKLANERDIRDRKNGG